MERLNDERCVKVVAAYYQDGISNKYDHIAHRAIRNTSDESTKCFKLCEIGVFTFSTDPVG